MQQQRKKCLSSMTHISIPDVIFFTLPLPDYSADKQGEQIMIKSSSERRDWFFHSAAYITQHEEIA
jgi:hypothetical protein